MASNQRSNQWARNAIAFDALGTTERLTRIVVRGMVAIYGANGVV